MRILFVLILAALVIPGCKKKQETVLLPKGDTNFVYKLTYDTIIQTEANLVYYFPFNTKVVSGDISVNKLTCSLESLPPYVSASPKTQDIGRQQGGIFTLAIGALPAGDYPFNLKVSSAKYGDRLSPVILRIIPQTDYVPSLAGIYDSCYDYCPDSGFYHYTSVVSAIPDTPYVMKITNVRGLGNDFVVRANVGKGIRISPQTIGARTIWGSGTFNEDARPGHGGHYVMSIADTIVTGTDTLRCTVHIEH